MRPFILDNGVILSSTVLSYYCRVASVFIMSVVAFASRAFGTSADSAYQRASIQLAPSYHPLVVYHSPFSTSHHVHRTLTSTSHSNFASIFNAVLETYKYKTKKNLASHPLLPSLQPCLSPAVVLTVLREQIPAFSQSPNGDVTK